MRRKRLTEIFPFIWPIRLFQKKLFFYIKLYLDKNKYSKNINNNLFQYVLYEEKTKMINENSGFDIKYQENKVHNLKLAANTLNGLLIKSGEAFSFWYQVRKSEKYGKLKDGLSLSNGKMITEKGGGLCHLSNFLFSLFLNTPLIILERHSHGIKFFAPPIDEKVSGIDATVYEGWLDLKMKNDTTQIFQLSITFDDEYMIGRILVDKRPKYKYELFNRNEKIYIKNNIYYKRVEVYRNIIDINTNTILKEEYMHTDESQISYQITDESYREKSQ